MHKIRDVTQSALERAEASAKLVERLEEETKKLKELTDSFNEKRMQDEKEIEEMRLREEILEREEQEQKKPKCNRRRRKEKNEDWERRMMRR